MISWFRRRVAPQRSNGLSALMSLDESAFASAIGGIFARSPPAENAMTVVAIYNFGPMESAASMVAQREGKPFDRDEILRQMLDTDMDDTVSGRRRWWFASAVLVKRLDRIESATNVGGTVWSALIEGAQFVPSLLEHNIVWKTQEKELVLASMSPDGVTAPSKLDAMNFVFRSMLPKRYESHPSVQATKQRNGLSYYGLL